MPPAPLPQQLAGLGELLGQMCVTTAGALQRAMTALLFHSPAAGDLRTVVSVIRAAGELGRMGDLTLHVAQVAERRRRLPVEVRDDFAEMGRVLMDADWPHGVPVAVDVTLLARYYERFADHAVQVARETVYAVTGEEPDAVPI